MTADPISLQRMQNETPLRDGQNHADAHILCTPYGGRPMGVRRLDSIPGFNIDRVAAAAGDDPDVLRM